jgi:hypothetical protein
MRAGAAFRGRKEVRSFHRIRHSNSGRILNLIALTEASGPPCQKRDAPTSRLFFTNVLNYAILTKHNVRENERELFAHAVHVATKVFIPFDIRRLDVGGRSFFIEESQFREHLRELLHLNLQLGDPEVLHDITVLEALSRCPTLDPFIVTECLRSEGVRIEPTFFAESYALATRASTDVFEVFKPLLQKALGKAASSDEMARFVDQVWNVTAATAANPFLEALQIPRKEWPGVIFAWKALIYYDLMSRGTGQKLCQVLQVLQGTAPKARPSSAIAASVEERKRELARNLYRLHDGSTGYIQLALKKVVDAILNETGALALSESLRSMAANIISVGMNVVLFEQVTSYFLYLYPTPSKQPVDAEVFESELANLCEIVQLRDKELCTA